MKRLGAACDRVAVAAVHAFRLAGQSGRVNVFPLNVHDARTAKMAGPAFHATALELTNLAQRVLPAGGLPMRACADAASACSNLSAAIDWWFDGPEATKRTSLGGYRDAAVFYADSARLQVEARS